jgi:hypothetical protein
MIVTNVLEPHANEFSKEFSEIVSVTVTVDTPAEYE